jgi:hypothetical protein
MTKFLPGRAQIAASMGIAISRSVDEWTEVARPSASLIEEAPEEAGFEPSVPRETAKL